LNENPWFGLIVGPVKHLPVLSYSNAKTFGVIWQAGDGFSFLCKLQGQCCKIPPLGRLQGRLQHRMEPSYLGS